ncbi:3-keto-steroid reductase [Aspergillus stella-maris]|uniref:3-keto-steroid reductase n=1 Tax=Aspergillus stella-maris TaxID=1810926 RepID=UPI003CCE4F94
MSKSGVAEVEGRKIVLVTGANSGLGFSICCRLADEFLASRQNDKKTLTVIFTTRSTRKGSDTLRSLQSHLRSSSSSVRDPAAAAAASRVTFVPENADLCDLFSVRALSRRLNKNFPKLDAVILNAGIGGWTGLNWPLAIWSVLTDLVHAVTWPTFKIAPAGQITEYQTSSVKDKEPQMGTVFCANVFGHYMLAHNVMPLLHKAGSSDGDGDEYASGRVIWVSSIEATVKAFDVDDIQGLRTEAPYESSKALTDVLALTSDLPSTAPWVKSFTSTSTSETNPTTTAPKTYLSHPGICSSSIVPLPTILIYCMLAATWLARMLGSPWHTLSTYLGACAPVWLALTPQSDLDASESRYKHLGGGKVKWGSSSTRSGKTFPASTEIDGWGFGGVVGPAVLSDDKARRRKRGAVDLTADAREGFEEVGRECWKRMEELRGEWEGILDAEEREVGLVG